MKNKLLLILILIFCLGFELYARSNPDRGFYGSLGLSYYDEQIETSSKYSIQDFLQEYKLGYMGNIYSPRLIDYTLEGIVGYEDLQNTTANSKTKRKVDTLNYKGSASFIKNSDFPFTIFANKNDRPTVSLGPITGYEYIYRSENYGLNGSMLFDWFNISYSAAKNQTVSERGQTWQNTDVDNYEATIRHDSRNHRFSLGYRHEDRADEKQYEVIDTNATKYMKKFDGSRVEDSVNLLYRYNMTKYLVFDTGGSYYETDYITEFVKSTNVNMSLRWNPKSKYRAGISVYGTRIDNSYKENNVTTKETRLDTLNIVQNFDYRLTPTITLLESLTEYIYDNDNTKGNITNIKVGGRHNYIDNLRDTTHLRIYTTLDVQNIINNALDKEDNSKISTDEYIYTFASKAQLSEYFPSYNTKGKLTIDYYNMKSTTDEAQVRYGADVGFLTKFYYIFNNNFDIGISKSDTTNLSYNSVNKTYVKYSSATTRLTAMDTIDFKLRLSNKGNVTFKTGVKYSSTDYDSRKITYTKPLVDIKLNYRILRNLIYLADLHLDKDITYDITNGYGITSLTYTVGKTSFLVSYKYYRTEAGDNSNLTNFGRSRFDMKLERRF